MTWLKSSGLRRGRATLAELQARITRLDDIKEIEKLQRIYGYYLDYNEYQKVVDLFSDKADSVEIADYGVYKGKPGVKRFYLELLGGKPPRVGELSIGMIMQGVVDVDSNGKTAWGRWQTWLCEAKPFGAYPRQEWLHGYYENKYVKENGKWLFSILHWNNTFCSPFEDGWVKTPLMGLMNYHPTVKPDAPPTAFHPYPSGYHLPYHYQHPITGE